MFLWNITNPDHKKPVKTKDSENHYKAFNNYVTTNSYNTELLNINSSGYPTMHAANNAANSMLPHKHIVPDHSSVITKAPIFMKQISNCISLQFHFIIYCTYLSWWRQKLYFLQGYLSPHLESLLQMQPGKNMLNVIKIKICVLQYIIKGSNLFGHYLYYLATGFFNVLTKYIYIRKFTNW